MLFPPDIAEERLIMGMRLKEGLYVEDVASILDWARFDALRKDGFVWQSADRIGATPKGRPLLNQIISQCAAA
jgi:oxygen-independent coproporphyrinogen-3 oxidase